MKRPTPQDLLIGGSGALNGEHAWRYGDQQVTRNEIAHAVLAGVPDGWAKLDGEWVQVAAMHTLGSHDSAAAGCPPGYYARLDTEQYEEAKGWRPGGSRARR
jgi:hypothetical protein